MKIQYIIHADFELPGIIESWAEQNRFTQKFSRPFAGESLPSSQEFDLLILMGGPQSPLDMNNAPYLKNEIFLIEQAIKMEIPVLGFCLGAQLIGEALGARTEHSPHKEVGVFPIELTEEGLQDSLLVGLPRKFSVVHWHNDMPGLTQDAKILATSQGCPRQIIRYAPMVYGFQCHPEITKKNMQTMIKHCSADLAPGLFVQKKDELLSSDFETINHFMVHILDNFLKCAVK